MAIRQTTDLPVEWLVLTHMHPDHVMGASLFLDMGAQIVSHENFSAALASRAMTYDANYGVLIGAQRMILSNVIAVGNIPKFWQNYSRLTQNMVLVQNVMG